jgi:hypothetical protein
MKPNRYLWFGLSVFFTWAGGFLVFDSVRHPGSYAEENILLGGILGGLGLVALPFACRESARIRVFAEHMGRPARRSRRPHSTEKVHSR